jgi:hypothetical protein
LQRGIEGDFLRSRIIDTDPSGRLSTATIGVWICSFGFPLSFELSALSLFHFLLPISKEYSIETVAPLS